MTKAVTYHLAYLLQTLKWHVFLPRHFFLCEIYVFSIIIIDFISSLFLQSMRKYIQPRQVNVHLRDRPEHWNKFLESDWNNQVRREKTRSVVKGNLEMAQPVLTSPSVYRQGCDFINRGKIIINLVFQLQLNHFRSALWRWEGERRRQRAGTVNCQCLHAMCSLQSRMLPGVISRYQQYRSHKILNTFLKKQCT